MAKPIPRLSPDQIKRVIATAFEDKPPYNKVLQDTKVEQERRGVQKRLQMFGNIQSGPPSSHPESDY